MKVGLYFGSFNPVHVGHLIIANHLAQHAQIDQVWLVVSPQNPLKPSASLLNEYQRLHLAQLAIEDNPRLKISDIEFKLPKPSYTIDTLTHLKEKYPIHEFVVIMGSDSFLNIHRWKNAEILLRDFSILIYQRPGFAIDPKFLNDRIRVVDAPMLNISSTFIRQQIQQGKSIQYLVPEKVRQEIEAAGFYR